MWPAKKAKRESWRPEAKCKSLLLAALSRTPRDIGTKAGLPGWRCSGDRAGLLQKFPAKPIYIARSACAAAISLSIPYVK